MTGGAAARQVEDVTAMEPPTQPVEAEETGGRDPCTADAPSLPAARLRPEDLGIGRLFWAIRDAVVVGDAASGRVELWSPSAELLFGYSASEAIGQPIEALIPAALRERHRAGLAHFASTGHGALIDAGAPVELPALHKSGETIVIELSLTPISHVTVPGRFVLAIIRDATIRKRAEEDRLHLAREQAARAEAEEALRARDRFLSIAAHELHNPVTVLKGAAALLAQPGDGKAAAADRQNRLLHHIATAADRLALLTEDLLDVSRIQLGQLPLRPQAVDLRELADEIVARYRDQFGDSHRLEVESESGSYSVLADPARLEQVLGNLLDNAIKYSPDGGNVLVTLAPREGGVLLQVRDQGIGLPPAGADSVFEPFGRAANAEQHHLPGLGLGLHICRGIIERHGGRIWAESAGEGQGATLAAWLPYCAEPG